MTTLRVLYPDGVLRGVGLPDLSRSRDQLIPAEYMPTDHTLGPTVTTFTDIFTSPGSNMITLTVPGSGNDPEIVANGSIPVGSIVEGVRAHRFWGRWRPGSPGIRMFDSVVAGPDPLTVTAPTAVGAVQNYGSNPPYFEMTDCTIDPRLWASERWGRALNCMIYGIQGGNATLLRCDGIGSDGIAFQGPNGSLTAARAHRLNLIASRFHFGIYENNVYTAAADDGQMHNDGVQFTYGKNITIRGCVIGGIRRPEGYLVWPGGWNAGDDFWNSAIMIRQTTSVDPIYLLENILIEDNWLAGGAATINHARDTGRPNSFESTIVRNNKLLFREPDWGFKMRGNGPGLPGYRNDTPRPGGYYIIRSSSPEMKAVYENNTIATLNPDGSWHDTGIPVPISNG